MSIQSDVEILSVQAVEYYSQKHHLSEAEVFDLFCKRQVFEKILIQHETLHQLDTAETFQYVEEIIKENAPELVLYHGSNIAFEKIDLAKSHNRRDFGRGFYCTILETQAEEWARRLYLRSHQGGRYVYRFLFRQTDDLKIKYFVAPERLTLESRREVSYAMKGKYFFNNKDITMNLCIQIRDVIDIIKERSHLSFQDAAGAFYHSNTYQALQNTENTLWAESAGYIADRFYEEQEQKELQTK